MPPRDARNANAPNSPEFPTPGVLSEVFRMSVPTLARREDADLNRKVLPIIDDGQNFCANIIFLHTEGSVTFPELLCIIRSDPLYIIIKITYSITIVLMAGISSILRSEISYVAFDQDYAHCESYPSDH